MNNTQSIVYRDKIIISDLALNAVIGVFDWEKNHPQMIQVTLAMYVNCHKAAKTDELVDAVDYGVISDRIRVFVEATRFQLIETLAESIARVIVTEFSIDAIDVTVNKPNAIKLAKTVGVMIHRKMSDYE